MDAPDDERSLAEDVAALREAVEALEQRTVPRSEVEGELRRYVRDRVRRGHARGWGPYVVLLYGVVMTVAAFYLLSGGWAVLAMFVVWTSTLGLYALMLLVGAGVGMARLPGRVGERVSEFRR